MEAQLYKNKEALVGQLAMDIYARMAFNRESNMYLDIDDAYIRARRFVDNKWDGCLEYLCE